MRGAICFLMLYKSKNGWLWFFSASFVLKVCQRLTIIANNLINNSKFWKLLLALIVKFRVQTFAWELEKYTKLDLDNSWNKCYIAEPKNDVSLLHLWIQCVLSLPSTEREKNSKHHCKNETILFVLHNRPLCFLWTA